MTLEEKAAQMMCVWQQKASTLVDEQASSTCRRPRPHLQGAHGLGQVGRPSDAGGGRNARGRWPS